jgi:hypothetical protein
MLCSGFSAFNNSSLLIENETISLENEIVELTIEIEILSDSNLFATDYCRRRVCIYIDGDLQGCTEWEYGECDRDANGNLTNFRGISLDPVIVTAKK